MNKKLARLRRARQTRIRITGLNAYRLSVHRTNKHIYAQILSPCGKKILTSASTLEAEMRQQLAGGQLASTDAGGGEKSNGKGGNVAAAALVGKRIAEKAKAVGIKEVAFDRSGFKFHGRIARLANAAREAGLKF